MPESRAPAPATARGVRKPQTPEEALERSQYTAETLRRRVARLEADVADLVRRLGALEAAA